MQNGSGFLVYLNTCFQQQLLSQAQLVTLVYDAKVQPLLYLRLLMNDWPAAGGAPMKSAPCANSWVDFMNFNFNNGAGSLVLGFEPRSTIHGLAASRGRESLLLRNRLRNGSPSSSVMKKLGLWPSGVQICRVVAKGPLVGSKGKLSYPSSHFRPCWSADSVFGWWPSSDPWLLATNLAAGRSNRSTCWATSNGSNWIGSDIATLQPLWLGPYSRSSSRQSPTNGWHCSRAGWLGCQRTGYFAPWCLCTFSHIGTWVG